MATKSNWWDKLLKIVIAVASAVLGAFRRTGNACLIYTLYLSYVLYT